jgi:adenylate cyclase
MPFDLLDAAGNHLASVQDGAGLVVGRSADCGLLLADPTVSRRHAELSGAGDHLLVHDLGSRNGTFRNGVRVQTARLRAGDVVTFGVVQVRVDATGDAAALAPAADEASIDGAAAERAAVGAAAAGPAPDAPPTALSPALPMAAVPRQPPREAPREVPREAPREVPREALREAPREAPREQPRDLPRDLPRGGARTVERAPGGPPPPAEPAPDEEPDIVALREPLSPHELTARRLTLLLEAAKALGGAADVQTVLERIVGAALRTLDADRAALVLGGPGDALVPTVARDRWGTDLTHLENARQVPRSIARAALQRRAALLSRDATADPRVVSQSVLRQRVRSAMCAPLLQADGTPMGALYVDSADPTHAFGEPDLDFLTAFAGLAAASLENARLGERVRKAAVLRENFARYFAAPVAERIAASAEPPRPGGERRTVAVLFADLRGFTRYAAGQTPDEVAATLSEFLDAMVECVFRHDGTLDKFIGDAVMAQWGAPEPHPDDADRALRAALDMGAALEALNVRRTAGGRPRLAMGIGLAHGEVFAGNIGSERRLEFTVIGDAVNQASKLCDLAIPGQLLLTETLRSALRLPAPALRPLEVRVPGLVATGETPAAWAVVPGGTPSAMAAVPGAGGRPDDAPHARLTPPRSHQDPSA